MMRTYAFAALWVLVACGEAVPVTECGGSARSVNGVCRPLCGGPSDCLFGESCVDGACLPGSFETFPDAAVSDVSVPPSDGGVGDEDARLDPDGGEVKDAEDPEDSGPMGGDAIFPDARPPRDASPVPLPDLLVAGTANPPATLLVGDPVALAVTVENIGDVPSGSTVVAMYLNPRGATELRPDSLRVGEATVNSVAVGATAVATITARLAVSAPPGERTVLVVVDPDQRITELDEANNSLVAGDTGVTTVTVEPLVVDFGSVVAPCGESSRSLQIVNRSTAVTVDITHIGLATMSDVFEPRPPMVPATMGTNSVLSFATLFHPATPGTAQNTLRIRHGQPGSPLSVTLTGEGFSGRVTDPFPATGRARPGDVVFVIDAHLSSAVRTELESRAGAILSDLAGRGIDYRVAVRQAGSVLGSPGFIGSPPFITPSTPAPASALADRIDMARAVVPTNNDGFREIDMTLMANPGLLADAWLEVIVVSEEDDGTNTSLAGLIGRVEDEKPLPGVSAVSGLLVPVGSMNCATGASTPRYNGLVAGTGGRTDSVCGRDWAPVLSNIGGSLFGTPFAYPLSRAPDAASIQVTVGGVPVDANDFSYDPALNRVLLSNAGLPLANQDVDVSYIPVCP